MGEFDSLDAAAARLRAAQADRDAAVDARDQAEADLDRRFTEWATTVALPVLTEVVEHVDSLGEDCGGTAKQHTRSAGRPGDVLFYARLGDASAVFDLARNSVGSAEVAITENGGIPTYETIEHLTAEVIRSRAIELVTRAAEEAASST
jgi:hypothetical protein